MYIVNSVGTVRGGYRGGLSGGRSGIGRRVGKVSGRGSASGDYSRRTGNIVPGSAIGAPSFDAEPSSRFQGHTSTSNSSPSILSPPFPSQSFLRGGLLGFGRGGAYTSKCVSAPLTVSQSELSPPSQLPSKESKMKPSPIQAPTSATKPLPGAKRSFGRPRGSSCSAACACSRLAAGGAVRGIVRDIVRCIPRFGSLRRVSRCVWSVLIVNAVGSVCGGYRGGPIGVRRCGSSCVQPGFQRGGSINARRGGLSSVGRGGSSVSGC